MSLEAYPDAVDIVDSNFKTSQQREAAETIAENWPVDLDRLVEEGDHVRVFYKRVIEQFLGPEGAEMTFAEIEAEHGDIADWPGPDGEAGEESAAGADGAPASHTGEADPAADGASSASQAGSASSASRAGSASSASRAGSTAATPDAVSVPEEVEASEAGVEAALSDREDDVDGQRRAWFAAGFREGILFALEHPHLVRAESE